MTNKSDKIKIAFVGLYKELNLGDPIIQDCTEWLFDSHFGMKIEKKRLFLDYFQKTRKHIFTERIRQRLNIGNDNKHIYKKTKSYFLKGLEDVDLAVVVGGGIIKYKKQNFSTLLPAFLQAADKMSVPVVLNAVGIEGYDNKDKRCITLIDSLHLPCVKYISTRDDITTLKDKYFEGNPAITLKYVADPAVWSSKAYNIKKNTQSQIIGIGVARGNIFEDYGISFSQADALKLYVNVIVLLIERGEQVRIFTNGAAPDNEFANKINNALLAKGIAVGCMFPTTPEELLQTIASFKAIVATRMHSCITAYSLDVPAIGLVWNEKMTLFGQNIKHPEYYLLSEDFNASNIVLHLDNAIEKGYNQKHKATFCNTIIESISKLREII